MSKLARIAILGRPNVGKSTLFNRICGRRRALVGNEPGMTRDRLYAPAEWLGKRFEVVDTGGIIPAEKELIASEIFRQARVAIDEAAHLVLVVDGRQGVVPLDEELAQLLRRTGKPLALAVNKVDTLQQTALVAEFHRLGIAQIFPISAEHGLGVDDLLEHVTAGIAPSGAPDVAPGFSPALTEREDTGLSPGGVRDRRKPRREDAGLKPGEKDAELKPGREEAGLEAGEEDAGLKPGATQPIRVAIIGRPNVGKSTLLNRLLNEERSIVTALPGTTRDAVDAEVERDGLHFRFIDTAGIRRKGKTKLLAEKLSVIQARKHLERADVSLLLIDATEGVTAVDAHIGGYAHESHRSVIVVVNKWDAVRKGPKTTHEFAAALRRRMKYLDYAPVVFISALKGQHVGKLVGTIAQVAEARRGRVSTAEINRFLGEVDFGRATTPGGKPFRLYYLTQASAAPPTFIAFTNQTGKLHFALERFLENRLRERFGFLGTPIVIISRQSK